MPNEHLTRVREFWDKNPVAASAIEAPLGTLEYFQAFDAMREDDCCEPYSFSDQIHGYTKSSGMMVLDVGCGNGYVLAQYARHGAKVSGVDLTPNAVWLSQKRFELAGLDGTFKEIDGEHLPYPDASFDIVCSMGVLHHISDPRPLVDEIHRVLKPGGQLIAMFYHRYSWKNLVLLRLWRLRHPRYRGKSQQEALNMNDGPDCPLAMVYSKREVAALLWRFNELRFDLNQLSWRQFFFFRPLAKVASSLWPTSSQSWAARTLGWALYVRAVKSYDGARHDGSRPFFKLPFLT